jgi:hypothetical protein
MPGVDISTGMFCIYLKNLDQNVSINAIPQIYSLLPEYFIVIISVLLDSQLVSLSGVSGKRQLAYVEVAIVIMYPLSPDIPLSISYLLRFPLSFLSSLLSYPLSADLAQT